jgi:hypothetical protein
MITGRIAQDSSLAPHADCSADPDAFASADVATRVYRAHAAHGPQCLQGLAASAYISADIDE